MKDPLITVLMAIHNVAEYLPMAVNSILDQTFGGFEFIIINDGSDDLSAEILEQFRDDRIIVFNLANQGQTKALNAGIEKAKGKYIARMDGDDFSFPDRLNFQVGEMRKHENLAMLGTWFNIVDEDGTCLTTRRPPIDDRELKSILRGKIPTNPFCHGSVLLRRDALIELGGYRVEYVNSQDYDLWLRLIERFEVGVIPQVLYSWKLRRGSVGAGMRMRQRSYSQTARLNAEQRSQGVPETSPSYRSRWSILSLKGVGYSESESGYQAAKASLLLQSGLRLKASEAVLKAVCLWPISLVAWAAMFRTLRAWLRRSDSSARSGTNT